MSRKDLIMDKYLQGLLNNCYQNIQQSIKQSDIPPIVFNNIIKRHKIESHCIIDVINYNYNFKYDSRFDKVSVPETDFQLAKKYRGYYQSFNHKMKDYENRISDIKLQMIYDMVSLNRNRHHIPADRFEDFTFGFDFDVITIVQSYCLNNNIEFEKFYKLIECIYSTILLDFDWLPSEIPLILNQSVKPEVKEEIEDFKLQKKFLPKSLIWNITKSV